MKLQIMNTNLEMYVGLITLEKIQNYFLLAYLAITFNYVDFWSDDFSDNI